VGGIRSDEPAHERSHATRLYVRIAAFPEHAQSTGFDFTPAVDLEETKDAYIVRSDLPGLEKDKIDLTVKEKCSDDRRRA